MSQVLIRSKLITALSAYAAAHNPPLTIARENTAYTKPTTGATFLEAIIIPANTSVPNTAADRRRFYGDFQVSIWTKEGSGAGVGEAIAEELAQIFTVWPKNQLPVSIEAPPNTKKSMADPSGWYVLPVVFSYRLEAEN